MAGIDDRAGSLLVLLSAADQKIGDRLDWLLRGRQSDALHPAADQGIEPSERQRQMTAALVRRQGVNFVDDHRSGRAQHGAARLRSEKNVQ